MLFRSRKIVNMTMTEALILAPQVGMIVNSPDELWDRCIDIGYTIAVEHATGDWVILYNDAVMARCH